MRNKAPHTDHSRAAATAVPMKEDTSELQGVAQLQSSACERATLQRPEGGDPRFQQGGQILSQVQKEATGWVTKHDRVVTFGPDTWP